MTTHQERRWRADLIAALFALAAGLSAMVTFGASYGGTQYLAVGGLGLLIGVLVAYGGTRLGQPYWLVLGEGIVAYFLFGAAIVASSTAVDRVLPTARSVSLLGRLAVNGWAGLLSTSPVVGNTENLLVIPFLCGIACGVTTALVALRIPRYPVAVIPPLTLLIVGILFGTDFDANRLIPGAVLMVCLLGWAAYTQRSRRQSDIGTDSKLRPLFGGGIIASCALVGVVIAPQLPLASSHVRYVLRDHIAPPFNINQYISPLSEYRSYVLPTQMRNQTLFVVGGMPANSYLQIASMDAYNGVVYNVAEGSSDSTASGNFATVGQPVSDQPCPVATTCRPASVSVHLIDYQNVWLPSIGIVRSISFSGPSSESLGNAFRYNVATNGAVVSSGLKSGDAYVLHTDIPVVPPAAGVAREPVVQALQPAPLDVPSVVHTEAVKLTAGASSDFAKAQDLANKLAGNGAFSDGYGNQAPSLAGHGAYRIGQFLSLPQTVGDSEQYAVAMALMARSLGLPARVELGVHITRAGSMTVRGKNIAAWVDIDFQGVGWYPFNPTPPSTATVNVKTPQPTPTSANQAQYKPPAQPVVNQSSALANGTGKGHSSKGSHSSLLHTVGQILKVLALIVVVAAIVLGPGLAILFVKSRRRSRRRGAATTSAQIAGGWDELLDCACDAGNRVPLIATRREQAVVVGGGLAPAMAEMANRATFGPEDPAVPEVERFWEMVDQFTKELHSGLTFWRRLWVGLSLASFKADAGRLIQLSKGMARP